MLETMSEITYFLEKANMNLLWEVLIDELDVNCKDNALMQKIRVIFTSNTEHFVASVSKNNNVIKLVELNKQFLSQIILAVKKLLFHTTSQMKKITIANEEINEPYKIEDIHLSRQNEFESLVVKKRVELEQFMTPQKPKELDFSDKKMDGKITSMDALIAEKMAERELDIHITYANANANANVAPDTWLKSAETSVKKDKQKTIASEKKVSWTENIIDIVDDLDLNKDSTSSIFNKLKKTPENTTDKQYVKQESITLPTWNDKHNIYDTQKTQMPIPIVQKSYNNETKDEISKINTKIDMLFNMMTHLQESLDKINKTNV